jgi:hypothetical protein
MHCFSMVPASGDTVKRQGGGIYFAAVVELVESTGMTVFSVPSTSAAKLPRSGTVHKVNAATLLSSGWDTDKKKCY